MSKLSAQCDELRAMAESVGMEIPKAATLLMEAADTIDRLDAENAKLRRDVAETSLMLGGVWKYCTELQELVREMHATISRNNSWWDCTCGDTRRFADRMCELGVEVEP